MAWRLNNRSKYKKILDNAKEEKRARIHSFHRYYGKLIPAIPNTFIKEFTSENDIVGDLFSGSGTVAVEAKRLGRHFFGCEINPLSTLISKVKTTSYDIVLLNEMNEIIEERLLDSKHRKQTAIDDIPFCVNIDHWFKKPVQQDLMYIKAVIDETVNEKIKKNKQIYLDFYYSVMSSIIRNVSNADPAHVFPGISKRIRKLEAEGKIQKNAINSFINGLKKRTKYFDIYNDIPNVKIDICNGDSTTINTKKYNNKISLFVTNPPYISSVRYIETMKLEMYWLEYIKNPQEYGDLAKLMLGNDKITKQESSKIPFTKYDEINRVVDKIKSNSPKDAYIVSKYFNDMENVIIKMNRLLKDDGKVVVKISDSNVKKIKVETGKFLTIIAEKHGFKLNTVFLDRINDNSRSLTTARNTYSDIINNDYIIIWDKVGKSNV